MTVGHFLIRTLFDRTNVTVGKIPELFASAVILEDSYNLNDFKNDQDLDTMNSEPDLSSVTSLFKVGNIVECWTDVHINNNNNNNSENTRNNNNTDNQNDKKNDDNNDNSDNNSKVVWKWVNAKVTQKVVFRNSQL